MKKRLISLALIIALVICLVSLSGCGKEKAEPVTRGEWITMLAEAFGTDTYSTEKPYYSDVTDGSSLFAYVQACAEWDMLAVYSGDELSPDKAVTGGEVASSAAIAAGFTVDESQYDEKGNFENTFSTAFALDKGIIDAKTAKAKKLTREECLAVIEAAQSVYLRADRPEKAVAVLNKSLVDLSGISLEDCIVDGDIIFFSPAASDSINLSIGDVFFIYAPSAFSDHRAYKAAEIQTLDGRTVVSTEMPTLAELYEELDIYETVSADLDNIIWADGVTLLLDAGNLSAGGSKYQAATLSGSGALAEARPLADFHSQSKSFSFVIESPDYTHREKRKLSFGLGNGEDEAAFNLTNFALDGKPGMKDFNGSEKAWTKELKTVNSASTGYKIEGKLDIKSLDVIADVNLTSSSLAFAADIELSTAFDGTLEKRVKLCSIPTPLSVPGNGVFVNLYLYADVTGTLKLGYEIQSRAKAEINHFKNLKRTQESDTSLSLEAAVDLECGGDIAAELSAFGVTILSVGTKVGGDVDASASVTGEFEASEENGVTTNIYREFMNLKAGLHIPIITLYAGVGEDAGQENGLRAEREIIGKEDAAYISLIDRTWLFWERVVTLDSNGQPIFTEEDLTNTYTTKFGTKNGASYNAFSFDYPDNWYIEKEELTEHTEAVTLANDAGHIISFTFLDDENAGGRIWSSIEVAEKQKSSFEPGLVGYKDYSSLGEFMVAEVTVTQTTTFGFPAEAGDSAVSSNVFRNYALMPKSMSGEQLMSDIPFLAYSFWHGGNVAFFSSVPDDEHTDTEVLAILGSFRRAGNDEGLIKKLAACAGAYAPYGLMEGYTASELVLDKHGAISGETGYMGLFSDPIRAQGMTPIGIAENEDGSIYCLLLYNEPDPIDRDTQTAYLEYTIYPPGVPFDPLYSHADWYHDHEDKTRIWYVEATGGIMDCMYYSIDG